MASSCAIVLGGTPSDAHAEQHRAPPISPVLKPLKTGLKVSLTERGNGLYEIRLLNDGSIGTHVVTEIGPAHLVLDDIVSVSKIWIPLTSIRSVIWTRVP